MASEAQGKFRYGNDAITFTDIRFLPWAERLMPAASRSLKDGR